MICSHTASSYTVGPHAYQLTLFPAGSSGIKGVLLPFFKLLYTVSSLGTDLNLISASGSGGEIQAGCNAAMPGRYVENTREIGVLIDCTDVSLRERIVIKVFVALRNKIYVCLPLTDNAAIRQKHDISESRDLFSY